MSLLPIEIVNMICRYNSHPVADEIRLIKQNFTGIYFPNEVLFYNRMLAENKLLDKKNIVKRQEKLFNEKINKIYIFVSFCINLYIMVGSTACLLHLFGRKDYLILAFIHNGYFCFYFSFLMFLIYFSLNISFQ
jgi:hypothetical protein